MKLLRWIYNKLAPAEERKFLIGDLDEIYQEVKKEKGPFYSYAWYFLQVLAAGVYFTKNRFYWGAAMFKNYLKIAIRSLLRQKGYSFINIFGLAAGLTCSLLVLLWVFNETGYDKFHEKQDQLFRISYSEIIGGNFAHYAMAPFPSARAFYEEIPEVSDYTRVLTTGGLVKWKEKKFEEKDLYYVDPGFLRMFTFPLLKGEAEYALSEPNSVVITKSVEEKIFGSENSIGQALFLENGQQLKVTGVISDPPEQSHIKFNYLISLSTLFEAAEGRINNWFIINGYCYLELNKNASIKDVEAKMMTLADKYSGKGNEEYGVKAGYYLQQVKDIHLHSNLMGEIGINGDVKYVYLFSLVAVFILVIACINFINLATARAANRAKEVGLRKVVGAARKKIIFQFFTESFFITIISLIVSWILTILVLPLFNQLTGKEFLLMDFFRSEFITGITLIVLFVTLLAGAYPSFYLSRYDPVIILKNINKSSSGRFLFRKLLVVFQYAVSVILIAGTLIIIQQIDYMKSKNMGADVDQVVVIELQSKEARENYQVLKNELLKNPNVLSVSNSTGVPGDVGFVLTISMEGKDASETHNCNVIFTDYDFVETFKLNLAEGRDFSPEFGADSTGAYIINEAAKVKFGWGENTIGKRIGTTEKTMFPIVGVVKNFNFASLKYKIEPVIIKFDLKGRWCLSVKIRPDDIGETMEYIHTAWANYDRNRNISYYFADENLNALYNNEELLSDILNTFSFIAIIIASLGLLGLTAYSTLQRKKEIGVRKVLGASIYSIVKMLALEYLWLIIFSGLIGISLAYYYFHEFWLRDFYYRVEITAWLLIIPVLAVIVLALLTSFYQAIKAALYNPVDLLRDE